MKRQQNQKLNSRSDNRGFSLVELIITVMILSIVAGGVSYGLSLINGRPAEQCARKLSSALSHARTSTMGKYRNVVTITSDSNGVKFEENIIITLNSDGTVDRTNDRDSIVGADSVKVEYCLWTDGNASFNDLSQVSLRFDSGSGKLKEFGVGDEKSMSNVSDTSLLIFKISKANTVRYVTVTALTGSVDVTSESPKTESDS